MLSQISSRRTLIFSCATITLAVGQLASRTRRRWSLDDRFRFNLRELDFGLQPPAIAPWRFFCSLISLLRAPTRRRMGGGRSFRAVALAAFRSNLSRAKPQQWRSQATMFPEQECLQRSQRDSFPHNNLFHNGTMLLTGARTMAHPHAR